MTITSNTAQWMSNRELANALADKSLKLSDLRADMMGNLTAYRMDPKMHPAVRDAVLDFNTLVTEQQRRADALLKLIGD